MLPPSLPPPLLSLEGDPSANKTRDRWAARWDMCVLDFWGLGGVFVYVYMRTCVLDKWGAGWEQFHPDLPCHTFLVSGTTGLTT